MGEVLVLTRSAASRGKWGVGGFLWAVTPLRQPIFDAGRTPDEGEAFFRIYNLLLIAIAIHATSVTPRNGGYVPDDFRRCRATWAVRRRAARSAAVSDEADQ